MPEQTFTQQDATEAKIPLMGDMSVGERDAMVAQTMRFLLTLGYRILAPNGEWVEIKCKECARPPGSYLHTMPDIAASEFHEFVARDDR